MCLIAHNEQELVCTPQYGLCSPFLVNELLLSVLSSVLQLSPRENELFYDVVAIVDPLTRAAQKMSTLLIVSYVPVSLFILLKTEGSEIQRKVYQTWSSLFMFVVVSGF